MRREPHSRANVLPRSTRHRTAARTRWRGLHAVRSSGRLSDRYRPRLSLESEKDTRMRRTATANDPLWYKDAIIYELPVKSFHDGNADGIGDFQGLCEKLDYLAEPGRDLSLAAAVLSVAAEG